MGCNGRYSPFAVTLDHLRLVHVNRMQAIRINDEFLQ